MVNGVTNVHQKSSNKIIFPVNQIGISVLCVSKNSTNLIQA